MTSFDSIYRIFLNSIQDYRIANLFEKNLETAEDLLDTWMLKATSAFQLRATDILFDGQTLESHFDSANRQYTAKLPLVIQTILSDLVALEWLKFNIRDVTQMNLKPNDLDFKTFSEERNLTAKLAQENTHREEVYRAIDDYVKMNIDWETWGT